MLNDPVAVEVKGGKIFIGGQDQGLELDQTAHLRLSVRGLRKSCTIAMLDEKRLDDAYLTGVGTIEGTLGLVGRADKQREVDVVIQAAPAGHSQYDWHTFIGASFADGEISDDDRWAVQARLPADIWARLEASYDAGQVREVDLTVVAPLWAKPTRFFTERRPDLMLTPDRSGGGGAAQGKTTQLTWRDRPLKAEAAAASAPADRYEDQPATPSAPTPSPVPAQLVTVVAWSLPAIVLLLAYIATRS